MLTIAHRTLAAALLVCAARGALAQPSGPDGNIPLPAPELQRRLQNDPFEIVAVGKTKGGIMTTEKLTLAFADGERVEVKWKAAPDGGEGLDNSPRRELGAYVVQQLFLDPEDFVVPPVAVRCIPFDAYRPVAPSATPNLPHARCIYGTLSAWLEHVTQPDSTWDPDRFSRDPRYAYRFGNLNVFTYLIAHHDAKASNFLMSTVDPLDPQIFSIDNGIAFSGIYNVFTWHFDHILVGGLPAQTVERLQRIRPDDVERLAVLAELQPDADGILRPAPPTAGTDHQQGLRPVGDGIQIGLTTAEIAGINQRLQALLTDVRDGKEPEF
jgi:hypothetical protein